MASYRAPLDDIRFVTHDLLGLTEHYSSLQRIEAPDRETFDLLLEQGGRFVEEVLHPLYRSGDEAGCEYNGGEVRLPPGYCQARQQWVAAGWPGLTAATRWGGQALPRSLSVALSEMFSAVNPPWVMLTGLPSGVMMAVDAHGDEWQKERFFPGMVNGRFAATMCLTEAHSGTDLGILRTKAEPLEGDNYKITGSKMFISFGEHDSAENIIHLVLARLPGAPVGSAGISMFIVPKFIVNEDQTLGARNAVNCGSIEDKMGYAASPTCVMNFDGATGYLVGKPHQGLKYMFVMMNDARIGSAMTGLGLAGASYQGALNYARERLQMRSLSGVKNKDGVADPIIVHPSVRQLLLTQKALTEGCRALCLDAARFADIAEHCADENGRKAAARRLAFLTPIVKGFVTEAGNECVNHGVQVLGGHGYVREHGMEQLIRDCRVSTIYEGTTQVQALDLIGRKIMLDQGSALAELIAEIDSFCAGLKGHGRVAGEAETLRAILVQWQKLATQTSMAAMSNLDEAGAASVDLLMYSGYVLVAWYWLRMVVTAEKKLAAGGDADFCQGKIKVAKFYFARVLPRTLALANTIAAGGESMMSFDDAEF